MCIDQRSFLGSIIVGRIVGRKNVQWKITRKREKTARKVREEDGPCGSMFKNSPTTFRHDFNFFCFNYLPH